MTEEEERAYMAGSQAAWQRIALEALKNFDPGPLRKQVYCEVERAEAIQALRELCREALISDDWPDDLHLADIVSKHITPHIRP